MESPKQFLDLFVYESIKESQNKSFVNCTILKAFGKYKPGDRVQAINIQLSLFIWTSEQDFDEEHIIL
jgi:hypothetical protein